ncbi:MAG: energy transducer TonB [Pyrinomonadaceae bacterium]
MKFLLFTFLALLAFSPAAYAQEQQNERDKGIGLYRQGEYEKAVEVLQSRVKTEEKDRLAWIYLGGAYVKLKKDKEAVKAFRQTNVVYDENLPDYDKKLKITNRPHAGYTQSARENGISGKITIAVEFGADGKIGFAFPIQKLPYGLTENALEAAKSITFEPAEIGGKPVTTIKIVSYEFMTY